MGIACDRVDESRDGGVREGAFLAAGVDATFPHPLDA